MLGVSHCGGLVYGRGGGIPLVRVAVKQDSTYVPLTVDNSLLFIIPPILNTRLPLAHWGTGSIGPFEAVEPGDSVTLHNYICIVTYIF